MPNIGSLLKAEILRLAKRTSNAATAPQRSVTNRLRHDVAQLKRQLATLERQHRALQKSVQQSVRSPLNNDAAKRRFVVKGFKSLRQRMDLSREAIGKLLNVTAGTIYNWESEQTRPADQHLESIAALRKEGKRAVHQRLASIAAQRPATKKATKVASRAKSARRAG